MVDEIVRETCLSFGCSKTELFARRRNREVVYPRGIAMSLCRKLTTRSTVEIGRRLGSFDHSTVLNIVRKLQPYLDAAADGMPEDATPAEWVRVMREHMEI
jgi:chromosomal replication initiator protein